MTGNQGSRPDDDKWDVGRSIDLPVMVPAKTPASLRFLGPSNQSLSSAMLTMSWCLSFQPVNSVKSRSKPELTMFGSLGNQGMAAKFGGRFPCSLLSA